MSHLSPPPPVGNVASSPAPAPAWHSIEIPVFGGRESNIDTGEPYQTMRLADLFTMPPASFPKIDAPAFIPSTYCEHNARAHAVQKEHGAFVALTADIDKGDQPLEAVEAVARDFAGDAAWLTYSSASSRLGHRKWRVILPLAAPIDFQTWHAAQTIFHDHLEEAGIEPDRALARAGQIIFAPNVPPVHEGTETPLREGGVADGAPLYFECSQSDMTAPGLDLDRCGFALEILERSEDNRAEEGRRRAAADEAKRKRAECTGTGSTTIERFNAAHDLADLLLKYEYEVSPANDVDWRSPHQTTGSYATRVSADDDDRRWWCSLSGSDREAGLGRESSTAFWSKGGCGKSPNEIRRPARRVSLFASASRRWAGPAMSLKVSCASAQVVRGLCASSNPRTGAECASVYVYPYRHIHDPRAGTHPPKK